MVKWALQEQDERVSWVEVSTAGFFGVSWQKDTLVTGLSLFKGGE